MQNILFSLHNVTNKYLLIPTRTYFGQSFIHLNLIFSNQYLFVRTGGPSCPSFPDPCARKNRREGITQLICQVVTSTCLCSDQDSTLMEALREISLPVTSGSCRMQCFFLQNAQTVCCNKMSDFLHCPVFIFIFISYISNTTHVCGFSPYLSTRSNVKYQQNELISQIGLLDLMHQTIGFCCSA